VKSIFLNKIKNKKERKEKCQSRDHKKTGVFLAKKRSGCLESSASAITLFAHRVDMPKSTGVLTTITPLSVKYCEFKTPKYVLKN
jgi:hypothetical protein